MNMMDIISEAIDNGIVITVSNENGMITASFVDGFYKSDGCAYMSVEDGKTILNARYGEKTHIESFKDVVNESYDWHLHSKDMFSGWSMPCPSWKGLYEKYGLIEPLQSGE